MFTNLLNNSVDTVIGEIRYGSPSEKNENASQRYALVVDDEPGIIYLCSTLLIRAGYSVESAENGRGAMEKIAEHKPDVVFLDLMMPVMDGFEVCERLKKNPETSDIIIAIISALDGELDVAYAKSLGANFYFPKPFYPKQFLNEILPQVETVLK